MCAIEFIEGGVTAPAGFRAAGVHAGFRANPNRRDVALVVSDVEGTVAAGTFTCNVFCAAPVKLSRAVAQGGHARAVILNSGNANAATGKPGDEVALESQRLTAEALGVEQGEVFVASTGVIGVQLPLEPYRSGLPLLLGELDGSSQAAAAAAQAIMTTDTVPKECAVSFELEGVRYRIGGMAKGSGMIMPNMATMLAVLTTDAALEPAALRQALKEAVDCSFNKVTVDSDTSTNDSCFCLANGAAGGPLLQPGTAGFQVFSQALRALCETLARKMAADGEGASKLVTVSVSGAASEQDADRAARTIANSPLVKTAIAGHDCNWGRIAAALGRSGATFKQEDVDIDIMGMPVMRAGLPCGFDEDEALRRFEQPEITIDVNMGAGEHSTRMWTCDLTHDYITINGDYRT
ncbi:MAG: bifunctional glutamate N-acetyltransferase/amino-acid acetyltransferase ArgJ [Coriobacteriales bacterium]